MKNVRVLAVIICCIASVCCAVPVQWSVESGGNGHLYEVVLVPNGVTANEITLAIEAMGPEYAVIGQNGIGWWEAGVIAQSRGGYLASIQSQAENSFIFSLINNSVYWVGGAGPWFGGVQNSTSLYYTEPSGAWVWSNNSVDPFTPFSLIQFEPMVYTNWYGMEPNNQGGQENVTHFCTEGTSLEPSPYWNDRASNIPCNSFVVEYEPVPEPATLLLLGLGGVILRRR